MTKIKAFKHFLTTYVAVTPKVLKGMFNIFSLKTVQKFVHDVLDMEDMRKDCDRLGSSDMSEICRPGYIGEIKIGIEHCSLKKGGTHNMREIAILASICKVIDPKMIFEFGTFTGSTTRIFALNSRPDAKIITLDLPNGRTEHDVGKDFRGFPEENKIYLISGDTKSYDFSKWQNQFDLVWIDACHNYDHVVEDTKNAIKIARSGGYILWHDYRHSAPWSGVTRHLREIKPGLPGLVHIRGTTIAVLRKP